MSNVILNTGTSYEAGKDLLSPLKEEIQNEFMQYVGNDDETEKLGFVMYQPRSEFGEITSLVGPTPLQSFEEGGKKARIKMQQGWTKSYKLKSYGGEYAVTKLFVKWLENGARMEDRSPDVDQQLYLLKDGVRQLAESMKLTKNIKMTKVLTNGFSITAANGPGSPAGDGQPLFSASHIVKATGATFSNVLANALDLASVTNTRTAIRNGIQKFKTDMKAMNGYAVRTPKLFTILCSREYESIVREALNTAGSQAGIYSGAGTNSNALNVFSFEGSACEVQVLDLIGQPDENGTALGATSMWFLMDKEMIKQTKSFRVIFLWDNDMKMYKNEETDEMITAIDSHFEVDHFGFSHILGYTA